jgi:hypothetical protein
MEFARRAELAGEITLAYADTAGRYVRTESGKGRCSVTGGFVYLTCGWPVPPSGQPSGVTPRVDSWMARFVRMVTDG